MNDEIRLLRGRMLSAASRIPDLAEIEAIVGLLERVAARPVRLRRRGRS